MSKYRLGKVVLSSKQAKLVGDGKPIQITRALDGERWFIRIAVCDGEVRASKRVERAREQILKLQARIVKVSKIAGLAGGGSSLSDILTTKIPTTGGVVRRRRRSNRKACPICQKKFRNLKLHIAMKHSGTLKSNLPHLKRGDA